MERLRSIFDRLNTTLIGMLVLGLAIALVLVPRLTMAPLPPVPAAPRAIGHAQAAGPEQPLLPPAPRPVEPAHPLTIAPPPVAPHSLPRPGHQPPPPPAHLHNWVGWIVRWLAVTGGTTLLACLVSIGLLLWRSWSLREHDIATQS